MLVTMRLRVDCPIAIAKADPDEAAQFVAGRTARGIASLAAKRIARAEKRQLAKQREAAQLLETTKLHHKTRSSWRAAVLARVARGETE